MICLQPGIIAWNAPQKIFNLFQTYLCDLDQVLFVCILSDIFQGKKKYSGKSILLPSVQEKNIYETQGKANG